MNNSNKVAQIFAIRICPTHGVVAKSSPVGNTISITGKASIDLQANKVQFSEKRTKENNFEINFSNTVTDVSVFDEKLPILENKPCYIVLLYTNGTAKVIGNERQPVQFSLEKSGQPLSARIEVKHLSSEAVKQLV